MRPSAKFQTIACLVLLAILLAACSRQGIEVKEPFSRPAPTQGGNGGAFLTIVNHSQEPDRLVSATSPAAMMVELHETINDNGVMRMEAQPQGFPIPAGSSLELKPGGKHIMLMGLKAPLNAGDKIEITLSFEKAGPITIQAPVREQS